MSRISRIGSLIVLAGLLSFHFSTSTAGAEIKSRFDLPAEPLDKALRDFAIQANCNISYEPSLVAGFQAPAIKGEFSPSNALSMMLAGTRLVAVNINEDTIQVVHQPLGKTPSGATSRTSDSRHGTGELHVASASADLLAQTGASSNADIAGTNSDTKDHGDKDLQEITVTGTHIRGVTDSASPVQVYTRADIDATGVATVQQFLQTLPQNFGGGASENTIGSATGEGQTNNQVSGSAPNLRGLGTDATLVLINGHRVASSNLDGGFVDISLIPLTAIERIEVVTDGASAIYGSDAVGGVVNFILRRKFDGVETSAQAGSVSTGSMHDVRLGQTVGEDWKGGSAVLSYQYFDQTALLASSRDYVDVRPPYDLLPQQVQHSAFASINQEIVSGVDLHSDLMYSHRSTNSPYTVGNPMYGYATESSPTAIDVYSAALGATIKLPRDSELEISANFSQSDTDQLSFSTPSTSAIYEEKTKSTVLSLDANLDGTLATIPAGSIRYAVGGQYRKETFGNTFVLPPTNNTFYPTRDIKAGYVEVHLPVVEGGGSRGPSLEFTLADRAENYSDFGFTNNPQLGVIWKPAGSLVLRGTYGTSFKAPLLSQLSPIPSSIGIFPGSLFNPAPGGTPNTLLVFGGNSDLQPEKATVWTTGLDFKPVQHAGFVAHLTYYDIVFKHQINDAIASICYCNAFIDEAILGAQILQRNPPASLIQQLISLPTFNNDFNINPATVGAIFDTREMNLSTVKTRGLDFHVAYKFSAFDSTIMETGIDGTRILAFDNQFTNTSPVVSLLNTTYNPTDLRLRGRVSATRGPATVGLYLNFTNAYTNNGVEPEEHISSWATADAVASYRFVSQRTLLDGLSVSFSVTNLTGRAPPYAANTDGREYSINYDGANANALGRYLSLQVGKHW